MGKTSASELFTEYCSEFLQSAESLDNLFAFSAVAITAWNNTSRGDEERKDAVENLKKRLKCEKISNKGRTYSIDELVQKMIDLKRRDFDTHVFMIKKADFENDPDSLRINVELL